MNNNHINSEHKFNTVNMLVALKAISVVKVINLKLFLMYNI
jgi:hypothetical protein